MTAAEKLAEKIRLQKIQEQDSLSLAKGLFGKILRKGKVLHGWALPTHVLILVGLRFIPLVSNNHFCIEKNTQFKILKAIPMVLNVV